NAFEVFGCIIIYQLKIYNRINNSNWKYMKYKQLLELFFKLRYESYNFTEIKPELFQSNPKYIILFRYLFGKSKDEYLLSISNDELNELEKVKEIDRNKAEQFQTIIEVNLNKLKQNIQQPNYLEIISDNFLKEEKNIKLELRIDKLVSSKYYQIFLITMGVFAYISIFMSVVESKLIYIIIIFIIMLIINNKYILNFDIKLIYVANIIQNNLHKNDKKLLSFVKSYLLQLSEYKLFIGKKGDVGPLLIDVSDVLSDMTNLIKYRLIHQLDEKNFSEVGLILKNIALQKVDGRIENYIQIKNCIEKFNLKFTPHPPKKSSEYEIISQHINNSILNITGFINTVNSDIYGIRVPLFIAILFSSVYYIITNNHDNSLKIFLGVFATIIIYKKK
ncbi:MAG: hypothetical protein KAT05_11485, partial [Spirochaetes bacterium]|nr:hypothetical protein [Spirochaetota bacterium]